MGLADEVRIQLKGMNPVERESAVHANYVRVVYEDALRPSPAVTMSHVRAAVPSASEQEGA